MARRYCTTQPRATTRFILASRLQSDFWIVAAPRYSSRCTLRLQNCHSSRSKEAVAKKKRLWVGGVRGETGVSPVALPLYWSLLVHSRIQPTRRPGPWVGIHARQSVCDSGVGKPERPFRDASSTPNRWLL